MNLNVVAFLVPVTSLSAEIYCRLPVANRSSVGLRKHVRSHCTTISTKIKLYKTFTRPDVLCGCEIGLLIKVMKIRSGYLKEVLRNVYNQIKVNGEW
jgi:hypothetical protein